jgi:hypothetical protein
MVNVYASSIAKSVFVWICICLIIFGYCSAIRNATRELNVFGEYKGGACTGDNCSDTKTYTDEDVNNENDNVEDVNADYSGGAMTYAQFQKSKELAKAGRRKALGAVATGISFVPGVGTAVGTAAKLGLFWKDYGGRIIFWVGAFFLCLIEAAWRPYKHLKG